jgi:hypothetical protein
MNKRQEKSRYITIAHRLISKFGIGRSHIRYRPKILRAIKRTIRFHILGSYIALATTAITVTVASDFFFPLRTAIWSIGWMTVTHLINSVTVNIIHAIAPSPSTISVLSHPEIISVERAASWIFLPVLGVVHTLWLQKRIDRKDYMERAERLNEIDRTEVLAQMCNAIDRGRMMLEFSLSVNEHSGYPVVTAVKLMTGHLPYQPIVMDLEEQIQQRFRKNHPEIHSMDSDTVEMLFQAEQKECVEAVLDDLRREVRRALDDPLIEDEEGIRGLEYEHRY